MLICDQVFIIILLVDLFIRIIQTPVTMSQKNEFVKVSVFVISFDNQLNTKN